MIDKNERERERKRERERERDRGRRPISLSFSLSLSLYRWKEKRLALSHFFRSSNPCSMSLMETYGLKPVYTPSERTSNE